PLKNLNKLILLEISNTDITSGLEYLAESLHVVGCYTDQRPTSQVKKIKEQLTPCGFTLNNQPEWKNLQKTCKYGLCEKCQKPNTNEDWCGTCNIQDFSRITSVPYEQFTNIEYLAEGGFGKNMITDLLQEITNHKLFDYSNIEISDRKNTEFYQQYLASESFNRSLPTEAIFPTHKLHSGSIMHSRLIDTEEVIKLLQNSDKEFEIETDNLYQVDKNTLTQQSQLELENLQEQQAQIEIPPK
ncbi:30555_t:CDS:2, partial [Racocetra persica]